MLVKIAIIGLWFVTSCLATFPEEIPRCKSGDIDCIVKASNDFLHNFVKGKLEIGIHEIDPFVVSNISISQQAGSPVNLNMFLKRAEIRGLGSQKFERAVGFTSDAKGSKFELYGVVPKLQLVGQYKADGRILLLPIQGEGDFELTLENVKDAMKFKPTLVERNGLHYLNVQKVKVFLEPSSFHIKLTNLFNGNNELGDSLNDVLNKNWKDAWNELSPTILEVVENIMKEHMQTFFDKNAYDDFYLPE